MNQLLPAPKSIERLGDTFVPDRWQLILFPQQVGRAVQDILELMGENWNCHLNKQNIVIQDQSLGDGFSFWLGKADYSQHLLFPNENEKGKLNGKSEGYLLNIHKDGVFAWSASLPGLYNALQTLKQMMNEEELVELKVIDWPDLLCRGVHVDAKGERPRFDQLIQMVSEWSQYKVNLILLEYEDSFPFSQHKGIVSSQAFAPQEIVQLQNVARDHFITIVPLIQSIGHAEYILKSPDYAHLRENGEITQFCSSQDEVFHLIGQLVHEVAEAHPDSPWIHIGGDEAWYLGRCADCADKKEQYGMERLYIDHINRVVQMVKETGKTPIVWDDVLRRMENREEIERLDRSCIIHYWDYQTCGNPLNADWIRYLQSIGFQVIGGSAMRGASGMDSYCPKFHQRFRNSKNWGYTADRFRLPGVIATSWGRYGHLKPLVEPFGLGWYGALAAAEHFWNTKGMDKEEFDQRFAQAFLKYTDGDFPKWLKRFEKGSPYKAEWLEEKERLQNSSGNFLWLLNALWKWRSEEEYISRKLELLEARLYRISEEKFPEWEQWRMADRAQELKDYLLNASGELRNELLGIMETQWANEYVQSFTHKYLFRIENVVKSLTPLSPRPPETLLKIGADYG